MIPHQRDVAEIEDRIADASGVLAVAHGRLVELAAEVIERDLWRGAGFRSPAHWLTLKAGLSHSRARQIVELASRVTELPATAAALGAGELTFEQAHAVAAHAPAHVDAAAASLAKVTTVSQIKSCLSKYRFAEADDVSVASSGAATAPPAPATPERDRLDAAGRLTMGTQAGRFVLHVDAPAHEGALIEAALAEARDSLFHAGQPQVTWFGALSEVCGRSAGAAAPARRDRYRVYVHLDTDGSWLNAGPAVPTSMLRSLTCDGQLVPLWHAAGTPISVGRAHRVAPAHTRRIVADRDRGCTFPGCGATTFVEQHHIVHWADGGSTDPPNLVSLCPTHHDGHHRGEFGISGNADLPGDLLFTDTHGASISPGRPRPPDAPVPDHLEGRRYQHPTGERLRHSLVSLAG